jgi:hypothetical protein
MRLRLRLRLHTYLTLTSIYAYAYSSANTPEVLAPNSSRSYSPSKQIPAPAALARCF